MKTISSLTVFYLMGFEYFYNWNRNSRLPATIVLFTTHYKRYQTLYMYRETLDLCVMILLIITTATTRIFRKT